MQWLLDGIRDWYNKFVDFIFRQIQGAYELVVWVVTWLFDSLWAIIEYILDVSIGEEGFVWKLFELVWSFIEWGVSFFTDMNVILNEYEHAFEFSLDLIAMLDVFFPVSESLLLIAIYWFFIIVLILIRLLFKIIPGIGG